MFYVQDCPLRGISCWCSSERRNTETIQQESAGRPDCTSDPIWLLIWRGRAENWRGDLNFCATDPLKIMFYQCCDCLQIIKAVFIQESFVSVKRGWDRILVNGTMGHPSNHLRLLVLLGCAIALHTISYFANSRLTENPGKVPPCQAWN